MVRQQGVACRRMVYILLASMQMTNCTPRKHLILQGVACRMVRAFLAPMQTTNCTPWKHLILVDVSMSFVLCPATIRLFFENDA
jgi:hypothetical protein